MKVVFIDGECLFCHSIVKFLIKYDKGEIKYSSLQSNCAQKNLPLKYRLDLDSVAYLEDGIIYTKSSAIRKIFSHLSSPVKFLNALFILLPDRILNFGYDQIAKRRHFISSKYCSLTTINKNQFMP